MAAWVLLWQDRFGGNKENSCLKNFYAFGDRNSLFVLCLSPEAGTSSSWAETLCSPARGKAANFGIRIRGLQCHEFPWTMKCHPLSTPSSQQAFHPSGADRCINVVLSSVRQIQVVPLAGVSVCAHETNGNG